jgi:hypothetical protein
MKENAEKGSKNSLIQPSTVPFGTAFPDKGPQRYGFLAGELYFLGKK